MQTNIWRLLSESKASPLHVLAPACAIYVSRKHALILFIDSVVVPGFIPFLTSHLAFVLPSLSLTPTFRGIL